MRVAVTNLASHAGPLPSLVTRNALVALPLQGLAHGLVLELVVLTVPLPADVALVHATSMTPHIALTLRALDAQRTGIRTLAERTRACVLLDTFL